MKEVKEYTELEWLEMSYEDAEKLIKFTAINRGIKIPEIPVKPGKLEIIEPDSVKYFRCELFPNMYFKEMSTINTLIEEVKHNDGIVFGENYKYMYLNDIQVNKLMPLKGRSFRIEIAYCIDSKEYESLESTVKESSKLNNEYNELLKEYKQSLTEYEEIRNEINSNIEKAHYRESMRLRYSDKFEKDYLSLIEDKKKALELMLKAYSIDQYVVDYIVEKHQIGKMC